MSRTVLQVPMTQALRKQAGEVATEEGFSSLQEAVRFLLTKLAKKEIRTTVEETVQLSPQAIMRYNKIIKEIDEGKNVYKAKNVDDFLKQLRS